MEIQYQKTGNSQIAELILRQLPQWFGIEESTKHYVEESAELPMIVASLDNETVGFISLKHHGEYTSEIYAMGVGPKFHRAGVGKKLLQHTEALLIDWGYEFIQVKTLSEARECPHYKKTRLFYQSQNFRKVEVFPTLWDKSNPCLLLIKYLHQKAL